MIAALRLIIWVRRIAGRVAAVVACTYLCWLPTAISHAHEVRPAYLELHEEQGGDISVLLKTPMLGDARLALNPVLSSRTERVTAVAARATGDAAIQTWRLRSAEPLRGQQVRIDGLAGTMTMPRSHRVCRRKQLEQRLTPGGRRNNPDATEHLRGGRPVLQYGIEHPDGIDHLLFVLALLIITVPLATGQDHHSLHGRAQHHAGRGDPRLVDVPSRPGGDDRVEHRLRRRGDRALASWPGRPRGADAMDRRIHIRVAARIRLRGCAERSRPPEGHIPVALLFFNLGVEVGQLLFVGGVLIIVAGFRLTGVSYPRWAELVPPYAIGTVAMFWVIQRVALF